MLGRDGAADTADLAINSAIALQQLFYMGGDVLEKVNAIRYLRWILSQEDDDIRAVQN